MSFSYFSTPDGGWEGGAFYDVCRFMTSVDCEVQGDEIEIDRRQIRQTSSATDVCLFADNDVCLF